MPFSPMHQPMYCRAEAYDLFCRQLERLECTDALVTAATAISMHALTDVDPTSVQRQISIYTQKVRSRVRSRRIEAVMAHAHELLFEEEGFAGNSVDYYHPFNSFLPRVLATRRGLPIALVLLYKAVLEPLGVRVVGVNTPGHFFAGVMKDMVREPVLIDAFAQGRLIARHELADRLEEVTGLLTPTPGPLPIATHRQWVARLLHNLQHVYAQRHDHHNLSAMVELRSALG